MHQRDELMASAARAPSNQACIASQVTTAARPSDSAISSDRCTRYFSIGLVASGEENCVDTAAAPRSI